MKVFIPMSDAVLGDNGEVCQSLVPFDLSFLGNTQEPAAGKKPTTGCRILTGSKPDNACSLLNDRLIVSVVVQFL